MSRLVPNFFSALFNAISICWSPIPSIMVCLVEGSFLQLSVWSSSHSFESVGPIFVESACVRGLTASAYKLPGYSVVLNCTGWLLSPKESPVAVSPSFAIVPRSPA